MADPISIAGTAIGVASLGIQVCQGLIDYLRSVEGRRSEISDALNEVQTLMSVFNALKEVLPKINNSTGTDAGDVNIEAVRKCLADSEDGLSELQRLLLDLRGPVDSSGVKGKMKEVGRGLLYPFQEGKLAAMRQTLKGLLANLNLAIDAASLQSVVATARDIQTIRTAATTMMSESQAQTHNMKVLGNLAHENSTHLAMLQLSADDAHGDIKMRVDRATWQMRNMECNLVGELTVLRDETQAGAMTNKINYDAVMELMNKVDMQTEIISTMAAQLLPQRNLVKQGLPRTRRPNVRVPTAGSSTWRSPAKKHRLCDCHLTSRTTTYLARAWGLSYKFSRSEPPLHRSCCRFYGMEDKAEETIEVKIPLILRWALGRATHAAFVYSSGSESPGLYIRLRNVVQNSPVYQEIDSLIYSLIFSETPEEAIRVLKSCEQRVMALYRARKASPVDVNECGNSAAFEFYDQTNINFVIYRILCNDEVYGVAMQIHKNLLDLTQSNDESVTLKHLVKSVGEATDDPKESREAAGVPCDIYLRAVGFISHVTDVYDVDVDSLFKGRIGMDIFQYTARYWENIKYAMTGLELSPVFRAIFGRSLEALNDAICRNPAALTDPIQNDANCNAHALQVSVIWPEGLRRLLETHARTLIDVSTKQLEPPLGCALRVGSVESVEILLAAGARLDPALYTSPGGLDMDIECAPSECLAAIARVLAARRQELYTLALRELELAQVKAPVFVPDSDASWLCTALDAAAIDVPRHLRVPADYTSIYHWEWMPFNAFPELLKHGFRDPGNHPTGLPAIGVRFRDFVCFGHLASFPLSEHLDHYASQDWVPADPWGMGLNTSANESHQIAINACLYANEDGLDEGTVRNIGLVLLQRQEAWAVAKVAMEDGCMCLCMPHGRGCSPLKVLWKTLVDCMEDPGLQGRYSGHLSRRVLFSPHWNVSLALDVVRLLTFEALDMMHTCCAARVIDEDQKRLLPLSVLADDPHDWGRRWIAAIASCDPGTVESVRLDKHEQESAAQLECLMAEFAEQLRGIDWGPRALEDFVMGPWRRRISKLFHVVDKSVVERMDEVLNEVETYVLPDRIRSVLDPDFMLATPEELALYDAECDAGSNDDQMEALSASSEECCWYSGEED